MDAILADAEEVFGFRKGETHQDRAHAYLERYKVKRGYSDTAMLRVVQDLVDRAVEVSSLDGRAMLAAIGNALVEASSVQKTMQHKEDA